MWRSATAAVATILCLLTGCDGSKESGSATTARTTVRVQLNWVPEPEFGGIFAAQQDGLYAAAGIDVDIRNGGAQVPVAQLVASRHADFGVMTAEDVLTLRDRGGDLVAVFAIFQDNPTGFLVHESNPITTLEQLWTSSSTIGVDANPPYVRLLNLKYGGKDLKLVPYTGALAGFLASKDAVQQCFITAEPVECKLRGVPTRVLSVGSVFNPYAAVLATSAASAAKRPDQVEAFVQATSEGWRRYLADPAKYNPAIAALNPSMSLEEMNIAAEMERPLIVPADGSPIGSMRQERWQQLERELTEVGTIEAGRTPATGVLWSRSARETATTP
jgi:NitT/TauT family transport system substrate-binding protein